MTTAQVVETASVTVNNNRPIQDYVHPDDQTQPTLIIIFFTNTNTILIPEAWSESQNNILKYCGSINNKQ